MNYSMPFSNPKSQRNYPYHSVFCLGLIFIFLASFSLKAQSNFTLSGYVKDASTGEYLPGANVFIKEILKGTSTNSYGFYSITVPKGNYTLAFHLWGIPNILLR